MPPANLLILHPDSLAPTMLATMLRALGHDRIETTSYHALREVPAPHPGSVVLGLDPIEPESLRLVTCICRNENAPPLVLLFTAMPPPSLHRELLHRAAAVVRFPLPTDQLAAALCLAFDASAARGPIVRTADVSRSANGSCAPVPASANHAPPSAANGTGNANGNANASASPAPRESTLLFRKPSPASADSAADGDCIRPLKEALEGPERAIILRALRACDWNRNETADLLQICRSTLYHKMRRYGLFDAEEAGVREFLPSSSSRTQS
jgi:hypothetical protein